MSTEAAETAPFGLIAGNGSFPLELARSVRASGRRLVVVAHQGETERSIEQFASEIVWVRVGQVGKVLEALKSAGVHEATMLGGITKTSFFDGARPDWLGLRMIAKVAVRSDDNLLRAIAREFEREGISIVASTPYLTGLGAPEGVMGKHQPTADDLEDVRYGFELAKHLGRFDIGQTVVVKDRAPIALEAIEGTDACIERGGQLSRGGAVVVKTVKPGQDHRFDLPAAGPVTVENCLKAKVRVLAVEAGGTLIADRERMIALADKGGLVVMGVRADEATP